MLLDTRDFDNVYMASIYKDGVCHNLIHTIAHIFSMLPTEHAIKLPQPCFPIYPDYGHKYLPATNPSKQELLKLS